MQGCRRDTGARKDDFDEERELRMATSAQKQARPLRVSPIPCVRSVYVPISVPLRASDLERRVCSPEIW